MRIKLLISVASDAWSHVPNDIVDWADDAAEAYIAAGYATLAPETPATPPADPSADPPAPRGRAR